MKISVTVDLDDRTRKAVRWRVARDHAPSDRARTKSFLEGVLAAAIEDAVFEYNQACLEAAPTEDGTCSACGESPCTCDP